MGLTLQQPVLLPSAHEFPPGPRAGKGSPRRRSWRVWLAIIGILVLLDIGISVAFQLGWLHRALTSRLEAAFGRPIEVSNFSFSLLEGPHIEANYITVGEGPRFGQEYFLRADQVTAGIRWSALLRGKLEIGSLSILRPSLNLVRLPDGEWNLESWLPRPPVNPPFSAVRDGTSVRPQVIQISDGRINFKQRDTKLPFAFVSVDGRLEQNSEGGWRVDLEAQPFRAGVSLQQAGELTLRGTIGGTSSRLRPASLDLNWDAASVSDMLRLFRGYDYGMRGIVSLQVTAQTQGYDWRLASAAQFRRLHRWDLPLRNDDPAANLSVHATWHPAAARLDLTEAVIEMPRSHIRADGVMTFAPAPNPEQASIKDERVRLSSDSIVLADALAWLRAFHPGVAEQLEIRGSAALNFTLAGWPPQIQKGEITTLGATADGGRTLLTMQMGRASIHFSRDSIGLPPVIFSAGARNGDFRLTAALQRVEAWHSTWKLDGHTPDVRPFFDAAESLGFGLPAGWHFEGPANCSLHWTGGFFSNAYVPSGSIGLNGIKVSAPFLNQQVAHVKGAVALSPQKDLIQIASANAFGTNWTGSLQKSAADTQWKFALAANDLSATAMDLWLNPRRRPDLLDRILPFLVSAPEPHRLPDWLRARGTLSVAQFTLAPFQFRQLRADAAVDGRNWNLSNASADFYGGALTGSMLLDFAAQPSYEVAAKFSDVHVGELAARTFSLANLFAGTASGEMRVSAAGLGREALLHSLSCAGQAQIREASYGGMDLMESVDVSARRPGITIFPQAAAEFSCANGRLNLSRLQMLSPRGNFRAAGYVDFERRLNIELFPLTNDLLAASLKSNDPSSASYKLTGSLNSPEIARVSSHAPNQ